MSIPFGISFTHRIIVIEKGKRTPKTEKDISEMWNNFKWSNVEANGVPQGKKRGMEQKKRLKNAANTFQT